jgi:signal peptidase
MKKTAEYMAIIAALVIMAAAVFTYAGPRFGWNVSAVLSGSMEPALHVGSLVVTCPADSETLREGDIITFNSMAVANGTVTHRISSVVRNSPVTFETKGDANETIDVFSVAEKDIVGRVILHIPFLGYLTQFMKTITGFFVTIVVPGGLLLMFYAWSFIRELGQMKKKRETQAEAAK